MTNIEILQQVIKKAGKNGYKSPINFYKDNITEIEEDGTIWNGKLYDEEMTHSIPQIIFSHDFCKAFWGEEFVNTDYTNLVEWQYHLSKMVLEKEPLKYLEKFL